MISHSGLDRHFQSRAGSPMNRSFESTMGRGDFLSRFSPVTPKLLAPFEDCGHAHPTTRAMSHQAKP